MIKKVFTALLSVALLVTMAFAGNASTSSNGEPLNELKTRDRNAYYVSVFQKIINTFPTASTRSAEGGINPVQYPDEYAGAYIDDADNLHIVLTRTSRRATEYDYPKLTDYDDDVIYEYAPFPLSKLYEVQKTLDGVMQEFDIQSTSLNECDNVIEVKIWDETKENDILDYLESNVFGFSPDSVTIESTTDEIVCTATTNTNSNALAGSRSTNSSGYATLGFNANGPNGTRGVVTAAHFATAGTTIYNANGIQIGHATRRQYSSGTIDAAFVPFPGNIKASNKVLNSSWASNGESITGAYYNAGLVTGMRTTKCGATSGINEGTVLSLSVTTNVESVEFTDQVKISNAQAKGDSGGPVFERWARSSGGYGLTLIGIATFQETGTGYALCSKAQNIFNTLSVSLYVMK